MNVTTQIDETRDQVLDTVKAVQHQLIEWNHTAADFVDEKVPAGKFQVPELPFADRIPAADSVVDAAFDLVEKANSTVKNIVPKPTFSFPEVPGLANVPAPAKLVDTYFDFVDELTGANRAFTAEIVKTWTAEVEPVIKPAAKPAARKAPAKRAARKTTK